MLLETRQKQESLFNRSAEAVLSARAFGDYWSLLSASYAAKWQGFLQ